ncbi:MAG: M73 family metallopeptidase [Candidatus Nomurabacteria bacterium]|jgi:hypothetical protein|nr:M73 family metallopeptidase [Candidatus Nomurabacteria bacterium]
MSQPNNKKDDDRRNRKGLIGVVALFVGVAIIIGTAFAFFSDAITGTGQATAGTLRLNGSYTYKINGGTATPVSTAITNLNPGDVVEVGATITPNGNKSAWVRSALQFTTAGVEIAPYIYVFKGSVSQPTLMALSDTALKARADYVAGGSGATGAAAINTTNIFASDVSVLNGTGTGAEVETASTPVGVNSINATMTIYFAKEALNPAQGKPLNFTAKTEALQYRNNSTPAMTTNDSRWSQAVPF